MSARSMHLDGYSIAQEINRATADLLSVASAAFVDQHGLNTLARVAGTKVIFGIDSISVGSNSTNASVNSYPAVTRQLLGARMSGAWVQGGVAGNTTSQFLARIEAVISSGGQVMVYLGGTNNAGQNDPIANFQADVTATKARFDQAGKPFMVCTVPPRAASDTEGATPYILAYNLWLRFWAASNGVPLADVFAALVDPATGYMRAEFVSADPVHPNDAGHAAIAAAIAPVLATILPKIVWPVVTKGGILADPLGTVTNDWVSTGGTPTATKSLVAPALGELVTGQWKRFTLDNTAGGSTRTDTQATIIGTQASGVWAAGDRLLVCTKIRGSSASAINKIQMLDSSTALSVLYQQFQTATPGPLMSVFTVPTRTWTGSLRLAIAIQAAAGAIATVDIGETDVFNLTKSGIDPAAIGLL